MQRRRKTIGPEDRVRAMHMLQLAGEAIQQFAGVSEEDFNSKRLYQTSLAWYIQAIGEAAARISDEARDKMPGVPWKQIVGARHILSHEYDRMIPGKLWKVLQTHLPELVVRLDASIDQLPQ